MYILTLGVKKGYRNGGIGKLLTLSCLVLGPLRNGCPAPCAHALSVVEGQAVMLHCKELCVLCQVCLTTG